MRQRDADYSPRALSWAAQLVRAHTDSTDGNVAAEVEAILEEVGEDEAELRNLIASLAGIAGNAVMVIVAGRLEADPSRELEQDLSERVAELRTNVLVECATALRELRSAKLHVPSTGNPPPAAARERRSGLDRRLGADRRHRPPGNPSEKINLRLFGERRRQVVDRRSGADRRRAAAEAPRGAGRGRDR